MSAKKGEATEASSCRMDTSVACREEQTGRFDIGREVPPSGVAFPDRAFGATAAPDSGFEASPSTGPASNGQFHLLVHASF